MIFTFLLFIHSHLFTTTYETLLPYFWKTYEQSFITGVHQVHTSHPQIPQNPSPNELGMD
ncbi:hypothetical protein RchiOBHm_Chr2g0121081 [Rosa chinensis]|uniref:Uncharacterized protein n=1 Tax=Rosa chinensis TaxID=74649 RepID=A0A2P6RSF5_ROSCH|nr:hypothetical protein RchiOBHm_Chr2g0121081 [Rosa chinensis]